MKNQKFESRSGWWRRGIVAVGLLATTGLIACGGEPASKEGNNGNPPGGDPPRTQPFTLVPAQDCDDVEQRLKDTLIEQVLRDRYTNYGLGRAVDEAMPAADGDSGGGAEEGPSDYTKTNVQEEGVDEADFLKTDGKYVYLLSGADVVILDSWPADETHEVGRYTLNGNTYAQAMFLRGDRLAIFSGVWEERTTADESDYFSGTSVTILDVSDRTNPTLERRIDVEGWYTDARMIDGDVYMVSNANFKLPQEYWSLVWDQDNGLPEPEYDADEQRQQELRDQARPILEQLVDDLFAGQDVEAMFPRERVYNPNEDVISEQKLFACNELYLPQHIAQTGLLNITHFDLDNQSNIKTTGLMANGWEVYSSSDNLYISMSSRWWWWGWGSDANETHIHKFNLQGPNDRPRYAASGKVDGWLLNQFSMSEYNGHLRVATTDNEFTWNEQTNEREVSGGNHLTILKQNQGVLEEVGAVRDLAPGEQVFSARFMGDKGYVVTFEQTDPLFTFDLSDPTNPKMMGELKINGFSSYMHPIGDTHLLTIGQDADDEGRVLGVHLQIFDVSDMTNPTRTYQEKISTGNWSSWSEAMWNHHAFTYHPEKEILAVPINIYEWNDANGENFTGLLVYKASKDTGFAEIGRVNHADLVQQYYCDPSAGQSEPDYYCNEYQWWTSVRRSIFMEDYLFSISDIGVKVNGLTDPSVEYTSLQVRQ